MVLKTKLMEDQERVVSVLVRRRRALVCEKAGKGKTLSVLAAYMHLRSKGKLERLLVLTPKNAYEKEVWRSECRQHTDLRCMDLGDVVEKMRGQSVSKLPLLLQGVDVVYGKHTHLKSDFALIQAMTNDSVLVCVDEVHAFKNPKTKLGALCRVWVSRAYALWALTATPLSRSLEDSYHIISLVKPGSLSGFGWFRDNICKVADVRVKTPAGLRIVKKIVGIKNQGLFDSLVSGFVIQGIAEVRPEFHRISYEMSKEERSVYRIIARGLMQIAHDEENSPDEGWLVGLFSDESEEREAPLPTIKSVDLHSSRFLYLQYAADGLVRKDGTISGYGCKYVEILKVLCDITGRGQSCIMYFDYYHALDAMKGLVRESLPGVRILESSGRSSIGPESINEAAVKSKPHVLFMTKAGAPSVSFYYINNVILVNIPTVPETFVQAVGRITRINTLFPGDLHVWLPCNENIDEYKLRMVTNKVEQMEKVSGAESNVPDWYRGDRWYARSLTIIKRYLLWK